jgi:hypothetical protein
MKQVMLSAALLISVTGIAHAEARKLTGAEIAKLLAGRTLYDAADKAQAPSAQIFDASGATVYQSGDKQQQGRWKIVGDKYCSSWDENAAPKCSDIFIDGTVVEFVGAGGEKHDWYLAKQ